MRRKPLIRNEIKIIETPIVGIKWESYNEFCIFYDLEADFQTFDKVIKIIYEHLSFLSINNKNISF